MSRIARRGCRTSRAVLKPFLELDEMKVGTHPIPWFASVSFSGLSLFNNVLSPTFAHSNLYVCALMDKHCCRTSKYTYVYPQPYMVVRTKTPRKREWKFSKER